MSHSSLPNPLPPAFRQETLTKTLTVLRQPFALAVIASLGVHGLLWFGLPLLPQSQAPEPDNQKTIGVVELSPTEQLRLPDFANPQITFPPLTSQNRLPTPSTTTTTPRKQAPPSPSLFNDSPYNFPIIPPPPNVVWGPDFSKIIPPSFTREFVQPKPRVKVRSEVVKPTTPAETTPKPSETTTPTTETSPPPQTRPEKIPTAAIDRLRELQQQYQQQRVAQQPTQQPNQAGSPTTQSDAIASIRPWVTQIAATEKVDPDVLWQAFVKPKKDDLVVTCAIGCADKVAKLPAVPSFLVFVNPQGKIINPPVQVKTGDKELDQAAIEQLQKFESNIPATGAYQTYQLRVQFKEQSQS